MSAIPTNLNEILKICSEFTAQNMRMLAVFDLDSTLFNVSTRTQKIIHEFADVNNIDRLKDVQVLPQDWGIKEALIRAGYGPEDELQLLMRLRDYWKERFFSNDYLHYDVPYAGAVSFVLELLQTGCEIMYLTGRDEKRMGKGSREVLNKWGFPLTDSNLFLKPVQGEDDELFKNDWFKNLNHADYKKIYFFENEPVNINAIVESCPEVEIIFLDTTHARKQQVAPLTKSIKNFTRS